jgi:RNA polymerase sigma-B factor
MGSERSNPRDRTIEEHLPMVRTIARQFTRRGEELEDLVQVGAIGLINAVDRYEPSRGVPLRSYASPCIVGEIRRHLRDRAGVVRIPRRVQRERASVRAGVGSGSREPGRITGPEEVGPGRGVEGPIVVLMREIADTAPAGVDEAEATTNRLALDAAMRGLDHRQQTLLKRRFYDDLSQDEIALELGISQVQVSRLLRSCLERLRGELDDRVVAR